MLLTVPLAIFAAQIAQSEPVQRTLWEIVQQVATLLVALGTLYVMFARPAIKRYEQKRATERVAEQQRRTAELTDRIEAVVAPLRETVESIHHTTTVNGGKSNPPTLRDEIGKVGARVDQCIAAIGAVAVNQANLSARQDQAERMGREYVALARAVFSEHDIDLPDYGE